MKSMIFGLILTLGSFASAGTTCVVAESLDGENFDQVLAEESISQDGEPNVVFERTNEVFIAMDNKKMMVIGQMLPDGTGGSQVNVMTAGSGKQLIFLSAPSNIAVICIRQ